MNNFENKVLNFIKEKELLNKGDTIVVGFSGGADSTALMLVLYQLRSLLGIELVAVHINHGIREDAGDDALFVREFCEKRNITCIIREYDIPLLSKKWKMTEEEAGRKARYEAFEEAAKDLTNFKIAVAHHQGDVAETLLMNLLRGSSLHGAGAIRPRRGNIIRPLLCVSRQEIEEYLKEKGQAFCSDSTNDENIHTRNIIRNLLIPTMEKEINSKSIAHLCRVAADFTMADDYIREKAKEAYDRCISEATDKVEIDLSSFCDEPEIIRRNILLMCFERLTSARKDITAAHIDAVLDLSKEVFGTARTDLPYNLEAVRSYDILRIGAKDTKDSLNPLKEVIIPATLKVGEKISLNIPNLGVAYISVMQYNVGKLFPTSAYTKWFDYDRIQGAIFRQRSPEDYIFVEMNNNLRKKKISKLMTDEKIPQDKRDSIYLLADGNNVIWIPGVRMSGAFKVTETTKRILEINIDNGGITNG